MLHNINQKSIGLSDDIRKEGCLFLCFAESSNLVFEDRGGLLLLNYMWTDAKEKGIIDKSNNVISHTRLAQDIFKMSIQYDEKHHESNEVIPEKVEIVIGEYYWKGSHFVVLNKKKEVVFDPLGQSNTVKNGKLKSMRYYYAI